MNFDINTNIALGFYQSWHWFCRSPVGNASVNLDTFAEDNEELVEEIQVYVYKDGRVERMEMVVEEKDTEFSIQDAKQHDYSEQG